MLQNYTLVKAPTPGALLCRGNGNIEVQAVLSHWCKTLRRPCRQLSNSDASASKCVCSCGADNRFHIYLSSHLTVLLRSFRQRRRTEVVAAQCCKRQAEDFVPGQSVYSLEDFCRVVYTLGNFPKFTRKNRHQT